MDASHVTLKLKMGYTGIVLILWFSLVASYQGARRRPSWERVTFSNLDHLRELRQLIDEGAKKAVVLGCGPYGVEALAGLQGANLDVEIVEKASRILPQFSLPAAHAAARMVRESGARLHLGVEVERAELIGESGRRLYLSNGETIEADIVVVCIGMKPQSQLLSEAGASIHATGAVRVDASMETTLPRVFACGTAVLVPHAVTRGLWWFSQVPSQKELLRLLVMRQWLAMEKEEIVGGGNCRVTGGDYWIGRTGLTDETARRHLGEDRIKSSPSTAIQVSDGCGESTCAFA